MRFVAEKLRLEDGFQPCPYCGGVPELLQIEGEDFIMRCSKCHASTREARMGHEEAMADWNDGDIADDHYSITMDEKIDLYLSKKITGIWLTEYSPWDPFPVNGKERLFSDAIIITEEKTLLIEDAHGLLEYEEIREIDPFENDPDAVRMIPLANPEEQIQFIQSKWNNDCLLSIAFQCGGRQVVICADAAKQCMMARETDD